jgi:hypothetical protein
LNAYETGTKRIDLGGIFAVRRRDLAFKEGRQFPEVARIE